MEACKTSGRCAEQCPSPPGFHLWEPSSSLGFQPRGPELLPPPSRPEQAEGSPGPYTRGQRTQSSTMLLSGDRDPSKGDVAAEPLMCSLPELYAFVQNFSKENTKLHRLNAHSISPSEAQKIFSQNLNALGETDAREDDSQPLLTCKVVRKDERPESMTELLHRSLLSSPLHPLERLSRSQRRISQHGIPPPSHTFPYEILISSSKGSPAADAKKKVQGIRILCRLGIPAVSPEKFIFEDRIPKYVLVDPEKQFLDLRDLEWKYYKGIVKWKHIFPESFINIEYDSEKRFVVSQQVPRVISPPLVDKSLVIYPQVNYPKK